MKAAIILFPTDFSAGADAALECATELAKSLGAQGGCHDVATKPSYAMSGMIGSPD